MEFANASKVYRKSGGSPTSNEGHAALQAAEKG